MIEQLPNWRDERIGPPPEGWHPERDEELLRNELERHFEEFKQKQAEETAFYERYGRKLGEVSKVYFQHFQKPDKSYVQLGGEMIPMEEARIQYTQAFSDWLSTVPEESRAQGLNDFFRDVAGIIR